MSVMNAKNNPRIIGLTGGIATGKTTVSNYLQKQGFLVFDSDKYVAKLWNENNDLIKYVKDNFNIDIKSKDGKSKLAKIIFTSDKIKKDIEGLIHPLVFNEIDKWILRNQDQAILFLDIPLLFEINYDEKIKDIVLVYTNKDIQIERLMKRNNYSEGDALIRINNQLELDFKKAKSNYILYNNESLDTLYSQIDKLLEELVNAH